MLELTSVLERICHIHPAVGGALVFQEILECVNLPTRDIQLCI